MTNTSRIQRESRETCLFLFTKVFSTIWGIAAFAFVYLVADDDRRSFVIAASEDLPPLL